MIAPVPVYCFFITFLGNYFDRTQFIVRTVKVPNTFIRGFSETSPTHEVIKVMLPSQVSMFSKSVFIFIESYSIIDYISQISRGKFPETNTTEN